MATGKATLVHQQYGKARVRVIKVRRDGARHTITDIEAQVMLEGAFDAAYLAGDNTSVVATDTMKNTVQVLAHDHLGAEIEPFALKLTEHFLSKYPQVSRATASLHERTWQRMELAGQGHDHSFTGNDEARRWAEVTATRGESRVESGVEDFTILKSTGSGFAGYPKDEFTTLPETTDRILATRLRAAWTFARRPGSFASANEAALGAMLRAFATNYSPSVQTTLFEMAEAALDAVPELARVKLSMPNLHCLPVNLKPFGREDRNEIFTPTDEPHGLIEATVERADASSS